MELNGADESRAIPMVDGKLSWNRGVMALSRKREGLPNYEGRKRLQPHRVLVLPRRLII